MKIVATVTDAAGVVHGGASVEARSSIIEIPDDKLPDNVKEYLKNREWAAEGKRLRAPADRFPYEYLTFSILDEPEEREG